jgi:hypothetical protein
MLTGTTLVVKDGGGYFSSDARFGGLFNDFDATNAFCCYCCENVEY